MKFLDDTGRYSSQLVWTQICDIVIKTVLCIQPKLSSSYKSFFGENDATWGPKCFEVLGFDIMLDASGKAWLFEVNHAPSFAGDSPLDREIKSALISSTLTLIDVTNEKKRAFLKGNRLEWSKRLWKTQPVVNAKKAELSVVAVKGGGGGDSTQNQGFDGKTSETQKSSTELLAQADHPEQGGDDEDNGDAQRDDSEDDNPAGSESDNGSESHDDDTDEDTSDGNQSLQQQPIKLQSLSGAASAAEPPVKLPSIRNIFQKKRNRISPCNPEADCASAGSSSALKLTAGADPVPPTTEFTNEFVQIYPIIIANDTSRDGREKSSSELSQEKLLYEHIHAAAQVNKSKLWS